MRAVLLQRVPAARRRNHVRRMQGAVHQASVAADYRTPQGPRPAVLPTAAEHLHQGVCRYVACLVPPDHNKILALFTATLIMKLLE